VAGPPELQRKINSHLKTMGSIMERPEYIRFADQIGPTGRDHLPIKMLALFHLVIERARAYKTLPRTSHGEYYCDISAEQLKREVEKIRRRA
jgi:hypothetical protein